MMLTRSSMLSRLGGRMLRSKTSFYRFSSEKKITEAIQTKYDSLIKSQDQSIKIIESVLEDQYVQRNNINAMHLQKKVVDSQLVSNNPFPGVPTQINYLSSFGHSIVGGASLVALIAQLYLGTVSLVVMLPTAALATYGKLSGKQGLWKTTKLTRVPQIYTIIQIEKGNNQLRLECLGLGLRKSVVVPGNFLQNSMAPQNVRMKSSELLRGYVIRIFSIPFGHYFDSPIGLLYLPVNNDIVNLQSNQVWRL